MARVSFLWHLHQPAYRTADGVSHAPWTMVHAGGSYRTLAAAIASTGGPGQVVNIVPTLLEQMLAYRDGGVNDPVVEAIVRPDAELDPESAELLVAWAFHVTPRQLERFPRLRELARRRPKPGEEARIGSRFGLGDLRDLQVLFVLAQAGEQAWNDERLAPLYRKGRGFSSSEQQAAAAWLEAQPAELIELWQKIARDGTAEIATSPFAHPIMPLLVDTAVVADSWAPYPPPRVPVFRHPEDARWQLAGGLEFMRRQGFPVRGCWPPEGSVSDAAVAIYGAAGVQWLVTDEGILERSLGKPLRSEAHTAPELYRPWRLTTGGPTIFFRDRWLSDKIGFVFGGWDDEAAAARSLVERLEELARRLPEEAVITLALDGENPWLHYPEGGGVFLRELMGRLGSCRPELQPATLAGTTDSAHPDRLDRLHPGSWINSIFATWIGHPEKTRAWEVLAAVRGQLAASDTPQPPSLLLAEGSDWFWWLGDDNPTELAPLYDRIFRHHLRDACQQAGVDAPVDLRRPLKTITRALRLPVSADWQPPHIDGRISSYFEWSMAAWVHIPGDVELDRVAAWADGTRLYLLVSCAGSLVELANGSTAWVRLLAPDGAETVIDLKAAPPPAAGADWALGRVAELSLPWVPEPGWRLEVVVGAHHVPAGGAFLLEPFHVDEGGPRRVRASI